MPAEVTSDRCEGLDGTGVALPALMLTVWFSGLAVAMVMAPGPQCAMTAMPGLSRHYAALIRLENSVLRPGAAADFAVLADAILDPGPHEASPSGVDWSTRTELPCSPAVRARDRMAAEMAMVGYSAREIADVLAGHLTIGDLNQARLRLMAGQPRVVVADFLDARWREATPTAMPTAVVMGAPKLDLSMDLDAELAFLATRHRVPTALVRAMVAAESGGNARAQSPAGAIGLMQLMPATAAALGVDPWQPRENLRGGITYLGGLLRKYGENARLALIAYNAGPQHANRVRAGSAVAYRETRKYLDAIATHYPLP